MENGISTPVPLGDVKQEETDPTENRRNERMLKIVTTVEHRQLEIGALLDTTIGRAKWLGRFSALAKVTTIVIGALIATSGAAQLLLGEGNAVVLLGYTLLGVATTAVVALATAFRFDERSSGLNRLSVDCRMAMLELYRQYQRREECLDGLERIEAALDMVTEWDRQLMQLRQRASELGLIIKTEFQQVVGGEELVLATAS